MSADRHLQQAVLDELAWEPSVTAGHIGVTAEAGVVTLTGHVSGFSEKHAAEEAARRVRGVVAVAEAIEVRLPFDCRRSDQIMHALGRSWFFDIKDVKVTAEGGRVRLSGTVRSPRDREAAAAAAWAAPGATEVQNDIVVA